MSYRMFIQPLTEKTSAKPYKHEFIVNTETGDISVNNSKNNIVSATKDIKRDIAKQKELIEVASQMSEAVYDELKNLDSEIKSEEDYIFRLENRIEELKELDKDISNVLEQIKQMNVSSFRDILIISNLMEELIEVFSQVMPNIISFERFIANSVYLRDILMSNKLNIDTDVRDIKIKKVTVEELLETKKDKNEYVSWVNGLLQQYNNLGNSSYISNLTFKYIPPEGGE